MRHRLLQLATLLVSSSLCLAACNESTETPEPESRTEQTQQAETVAYKLDIVPSPPEASVPARPSVLAADYKPPPPLEPVPISEQQTDPVIRTLQRASAGCTGVAITKFTKGNSRAVSSFPGIVTDFQVSTSKILMGAVPATVTQQGGTIGKDTITVSEQPEIPLGNEVFAIFFNNRHGQYVSLVALLADSDHVVIGGKTVPIESVMTTIAAAQKESGL